MGINAMGMGFSNPAADMGNLMKQVNEIENNFADKMVHFTVEQEVAASVEQSKSSAVDCFA